MVSQYQRLYMLSFKEKQKIRIRSEKKMQVQAFK